MSNRPSQRHGRGDGEGNDSIASTCAAELTDIKSELRKGLIEYPDFPEQGITFVDIMPLFANASYHALLIQALDLHIQSYKQKPDVIVGLEARGFLFGPTLALRLGCAFVPVRKAGKLPGPCHSVSYVKEYGKDTLELQEQAIKPQQNVLIVDDVIATGGTALAAGELVRKCQANLLGYCFILEIDGLKGRDKLDGSIYTLLPSEMK